MTTKSGESSRRIVALTLIATLCACQSAAHAATATTTASPTTTRPIGTSPTARTRVIAPTTALRPSPVRPTTTGVGLKGTATTTKGQPPTTTIAKGRVTTTTLLSVSATPTTRRTRITVRPIAPPKPTAATVADASVTVAAARRKRDAKALIAGLRMLGLRLLEAKRPAESATALREAVGLLNAPGDLLERRETEATLGWALNTAGDFKGGVTVLQDALRLGDEQRATQPVMVNILKLLVWGARASSDHESAVNALERLRDFGEKGDSTIDLGDTYEGLAVERLLMKSVGPAVSYARKAVAARANAKPVVLAGSYQVLGWALDSMDSSPEAIQALKKSIDLRRQAGVAASENLEALLLLANSARKAGDADTSFTARRDVIQIARDRGDAPALADGLDELGLAALLLQRPQIAVPPLTEAVALRRSSGASVAFGRSLHLLGWALSGSGRKDEAVGTYNEAAEIRRQVGDTREVQLESLRALGYLLWELKRGNEAIPPFERSLALVRKDPSDAPSEAAALTDLSVAYLIGSIPDKALEPAQTAIDLFERIDKKGEALAAALYAYGWALFSNARQKEAIDPFRRSLAIREAAGSAKIDETRSFLQAAIESSGPGG